MICSWRLSLSVGREDCLGMVNLIRGRRSIYFRLGKEASLVKYAALGGDKSCMAMEEEKVTVHDSVENRKEFFVPLLERMGFFTGAEDKGITAWETNTVEVVYAIKDAHSARVKGIVVMSSSDEGKNKDPYLIASASSDGITRGWDIRSFSYWEAKSRS